MMAADAVRDGRLAWPFPERVETALGYWLVRPEGRRMPDKLRAFRDWLLDEVTAPAAHASIASAQLVDSAAIG